MAKYKVLFFDSWKGGSHNFHRLVDAFQAVNIETLLVHLGSWGNEDELVREENLGQLKTRDIAYYKSSNLEKLLLTEKPDLVLFLSCHTFAHRAVNRYCRKYQIPTILLMHGVAQVIPVDKDNQYQYQLSIKQYVLYIMSKFPKLFMYTFPCYIRALITTKAKVQDWLAFLMNIVDALTKPSKQRTADDGVTNICLTYIEADNNLIARLFGFSVSQMVAVGNPDLIHFGLNAQLIGSAVNEDIQHLQPVVYINTSQLSGYSLFDTKEEYVKFVVEIHQSLLQQGKRLILKPHPQDAKEFDLSVFEKQGIEVLDKKSFVPALQKSCAAIVEPSSAAVIPALFGLPVMMLKRGRFVNAAYGELLTAYPRAMYLTDITKFSQLLQDEFAGVNRENVLAWIKQYSGPLPAEDMPMRVANIALELIKHGVYKAQALPDSILMAE